MERSAAQRIGSDRIGSARLSSPLLSDVVISAVCVCSFIKEYLGASVSADTDKLKSTIDSQAKLIEEKDREIQQLKKQVRGRGNTHTAQRRRSACRSLVCPRLSIARGAVEWPSTTRLHRAELSRGNSVERAGQALTRTAPHAD